MDGRCFSEQHGENIILSEDKRTATWNHVYSGGILFSDKPISETTRGLCVRLIGSGHVHIGFMEKDPSSLDDVRSAYENGDIKTVNVFRFHKRPCSVDVKMQRNEFILTHLDEPYKVTTRDDAVWLAVYIKLGDATVTLDSDDGLRLHRISGENIERLSTTKLSAKLRVENPNAMCCLPLLPGESYNFEFYISPIYEHKRGPPKRYHATFGISNFNLLDNNSSQSDTNREYQILHVFERVHNKDGCQGTLGVNVHPSEGLTYEHSLDRNAKGTINIKDYRTLFLCFDLYRVHITICDEEPYDDILSIGASIDDVADCAKANIDNPSALNDILDKTESLCQRLEPEAGQGDYYSLLPRTDADHMYMTLYSQCNLTRALKSIKTDVETMTSNLQEPQSANDIVNDAQQSLEVQNKIYEKLKKIEEKIDSGNVPKVPANPLQTNSSDNMKQSMQNNSADMISQLEPFPFCDHLLQDHMITKAHYEELFSMKDCSSKSDMNRNLMTILWRRKLDFTKIQSALKITEQEHLSHFFDDAK